VPLYEYACDACGERFEIIQKFSDAPPAACPKCGKGPVVRQMSSPAIQFKGTGWYITDYSQKGKSGSDGAAAEKKSSGTSGDKPAAADTSKADSTPAATTTKPSSTD
jgi:putative FmdB family regulatory protein